MESSSLEQSHQYPLLTPQSTSLPIIDLGPFFSPSGSRSDQLRIAAQLRQSCETLGFFYVTNHRVSPALCAQLLRTAETFFRRDAGLKRRFSMGRTGRLGRGYQGLAENVTMGQGDQCEAVDFMQELSAEQVGHPGPGLEGVRRLGCGKNLWVEDGLEQLVGRYCAEVRRAARKVMEAIGLALDDSATGAALDDEGFWILRIIRYPERGETAGGLGCGVHRDYGFLTFVLQDEARGALQVQKPDGTWIAADPIPGTFVVNVGDCLQRLTRDVFKSTPHRVDSPVGRARISIPCFIEPSFTSTLAFDDEQHGVGSRKNQASVLDGFKTYGAYLFSKVSTNFQFDVTS